MALGGEIIVFPRRLEDYPAVHFRGRMPLALFALLQLLVAVQVVWPVYGSGCTSVICLDERAIESNPARECSVNEARFARRRCGEIRSLRRKRRREHLVIVGVNYIGSVPWSVLILRWFCWELVSCRGMDGWMDEWIYTYVCSEVIFGADGSQSVDAVYSSDTCTVSFADRRSPIVHIFRSSAVSRVAE